MGTDSIKSAERNDSGVPKDEFSAVASAAAVLTVVERDGAFQAIKRARNALSGIRKQLLSCVVAVYTIADYARSNSDAWMEICNQSEWLDFDGAKPSPDHPEEALRYVMRLVVGIETRDVLKKASSYTLALQGMFDDGVPPTAVESRIREAGGLRELEKAQASKRSSRRIPTAPSHTKFRDPRRLMLPLNELLLVSVTEFEILTINYHLTDYAGLSDAQALRWKNGLKAMLGRRVDDLKNGGKPNPIFDDLAGMVHLDG